MIRRLLNGNISLFYAITIVLTLFLSILILLDPAYDTGDDALMNYIAAGTFTGAPDAAIIFSNFLEGMLLKWLYIHFPSINWYPLFLYFLQAIALLQLTHLFHKINPTKRYFLLYFLSLLIFFTYMIIKLQFTTTAILLGAAGLFTLLYQLKSEKYTIWSYTKIIVFLSLCVLVRWECFIALLIQFAPIVFWKYRRMGLQKKHWMYAAILIFPITIMICQYNYYKTSSQNYNYLTYQLATHKLLDYEGKISTESLAAAGLSTSDYQLFKNYFWADEKVFKPENIIQLADSKQNAFNISKGINVLTDYGSTFVFYGAFMLIAFATFLLSSKNDRYKIALFTLFIHLILLLLGSYFKLPVRLYLAVCLIAALLLVYEFGNSVTISRLKPSLIICLSGIFFLALVQLRITLNISFFHREQIALNQRSFDLINSHSNILYIDIDFSEQLHRPHLFSAAPKVINHNLFDGSSFINTPTYHSVLAKNNIKNLTIDLVGKSTVFISNDTRFYMNFQQFMREHYGVECAFVEYNGLEDAQQVIWK